MRLRMICYDISEDKYRNKIADLLLRYGNHRLQKSVFTGLQKEEDFSEMKVKIDKLISKTKEPSNSIYYIVMSQEMFRNMQKSGIAPDFDLILDRQVIVWI
jgi:CRISPR-associated endonuclease Cas2